MATAVAACHGRRGERSPTTSNERKRPGVSLKIRHNLESEELVKALSGIARSEGISDQLFERLEKARRPGYEPKVPRDPFIAELHEQMHERYAETIEWVRDFVDQAVRKKRGLKDRVLRKADELIDRPLTKEEVRAIQQAIRDRFDYLATSLESQDVDVSDEQLRRWKDLGLIDKKVTVKDFVSRNPEGKLVRNAFVYGRFAQAAEQASGEQDLRREVMRAALKMPLTRPDEAALAVAEQQAGKYITGLGEQIAGKAGELLLEKNRAIVREMVTGVHGQTLQAGPPRTPGAGGLPEATGKAVENWRELSSELYHAMEDRAHDWDRVAFYELNDSKRYGKAVGLVQKYGEGQLVYKDPMPTACAQCRALYLDDNGHPRLFKLGQMLSAGSNVGKKPMPVKGGEVASSTRPDGAATYDAVAGLVHPWCQCEGPNIFTGLEWWADKVEKP